MIVNTGLDYFNNVKFGNTATSNLYIALFQANYTPVLTDTAVTFIANMLEVNAEYDEATRPQFISGNSVNGLINNSDNLAVFTFNATIKVYGGALLTIPTKTDSSGILIQATRFSSPKTYVTGDILKLPWYLISQNL